MSHFVIDAVQLRKEPAHALKKIEELCTKLLLLNEDLDGMNAFKKRVAKLIESVTRAQERVFSVGTSKRK